MNYKNYFNPELVRFIDTPSILTQSKLSGGSYSANPYIGCPHACMYCYVPAMSHGPVTGVKNQWGTYLHVKRWSPILPEIARTYSGKRITIGTATDPYNPLEAHFKRTRALLEELVDSNAKVSIITKSDLILRDLDILPEFDNLVVAFSINTLDEKFKDDMDAAPSISRRLHALRACKDMGLITSCFISPLFPEITDPFEIIEEVRNHCDSIWIDGLNLQEKNIGKVTGYISSEYSWAFPIYKKIYKDGDKTYWLTLSDKIKDYANKNGMEYTTSKIVADRSPFGCPVIIDFLHRRIERQ